MKIEKNSAMILVGLLIAANLIATSIIYRFISGDISYLANDAWQFIEDPFKKTRGFSRYLTIFAHPYLHNLKPFFGVLADLLSFLLVLLTMARAAPLEKKYLWPIAIACLTLPLWSLLVSWYPWPGQMSVINLVTALYFYLILVRSSKFSTDLILSVAFIFFSMAYYEIYCLFPAFVPLFKSYKIRSYLAFMAAVFAGILLSYALAQLYQLYFWGGGSQIHSYRELVDTDGASFISKYFSQYLAALNAVKTGLFPSGSSWIIGLIASAILCVAAIRNSIKFVHIFIIIGMFVSMFAVSNHIILARNMAPLFILPFAVYITIRKHKIIAGAALSVLCSVFVFNSITVPVQYQKRTAIRIAAMMDEVKTNLQNTPKDRPFIFVGRGADRQWRYDLLNAVNYNIGEAMDIDRCGEQYNFGLCGREIKRNPEFKQWLCGAPENWAQYETASYRFVSVGEHRKLKCNP